MYLYVISILMLTPQKNRTYPTECMAYCLLEFYKQATGKLGAGTNRIKIEQTYAKSGGKS